MSVNASERVELWSKKLRMFGVDRFSFTDAVRSAAKQRQERYTGFIELNDDPEGMTSVRSFTRTRYPRKKYGIPTIQECEAGMTFLADTIGGILPPSLVTDEQTQEFRVVLGLLEGYDRSASLHNVSEVAGSLPYEQVDPAEVFAVRITSDSLSIYTEPAAIVRGSLSRLGAVHELAEAFHQERYTVEDFSNGFTYMVETCHCTEPDA
jgi:hypothetical protein